MSITTRMSSALAAVVGATLLLAGSSAAQTVRTKSAPAPSPALALESQARPLMDQPKQWRAMAELFTQAAQIRAANDPRGVDDLMVAAAAYGWAGKRTPARTN